MRCGTPTTPAATLTDERGFTLIEVLVIMVIVGILAAIALPSLLDNREKGMDAAAKTDVRQLAGLVSQCKLEHAGYDQCDSQAEMNGTAGLIWSNTDVAGTVRVSAAGADSFTATAVSHAASNGQLHTFDWKLKSDGTKVLQCKTGAAGDDGGGCHNGQW